MCPMQREDQHIQNVRVWSRKRFIAGPTGRPGGSCLKTPEAPEGFQQGILKGKMRKGQSWLL